MMGLSEVDMIEVPRVNTCDVILPTGIVFASHTHKGDKPTNVPMHLRICT